MPASLRGGANAYGGTEDKEYFVLKMLSRAIPNLVHDRWATTDYIPSNRGQSLEWRRMEALTATTTALTEGTPGGESIPTITTVTATLNQYGLWFRSTDVVQSAAIDDVKAEGAKMLGEILGQSRDLLMRNVMRGTTSIQYAGTAGSRGGVGSGMYFNSAELREALATLKRNNAKPFGDGSYKVIIHPNTEADLFNDPNLVNAFSFAGERGGDNPLFQGRLGRYLGADFYTTSQASIQANAGFSITTGADVYQTMIFGQEAYGASGISALNVDLIFHEPGSAGVFDPLNQLWSEGFKFSFGGAILNNSWIVSVEHTTSLGTI